jgi:hypothetical protein
MDKPRNNAFGQRKPFSRFDCTSRIGSVTLTYLPSMRFQRLPEFIIDNPEFRTSAKIHSGSAFKCGFRRPVLGSLRVAIASTAAPAASSNSRRILMARRDGRQDRRGNGHPERVNRRTMIGGWAPHPQALEWVVQTAVRRTDPGNQPRLRALPATSRRWPRQRSLAASPIERPCSRISDLRHRRWFTRAIADVHWRSSRWHLKTNAASLHCIIPL